jgi:hypothetical protein
MSEHPSTARIAAELTAVRRTIETARHMMMSSLRPEMWRRIIVDAEQRAQLLEMLL